MGITDILLDPLDLHSEYINIIKHHGELTLDQVRAFVATYITQESRAAQDDYAMYRCMRNSVTKNSLTRLGVWTNQYHIDEYASGNCFLKVMTRESGLETKSTTTFIRQTLTTLDERMKSYGDDVLKFNTYVKGLI